MKLMKMMQHHCQLLKIGTRLNITCNTEEIVIQNFLFRNTKKSSRNVFSLLIVGIVIKWLSNDYERCHTTINHLQTNNHWEIVNSLSFLLRDIIRVALQVTSQATLFWSGMNIPQQCLRRIWWVNKVHHTWTDNMTRWVLSRGGAV